MIDSASGSGKGESGEERCVCVCMCVCVGGGGERERMEEGGEGGMKESGGRRKERHHLVCVQVLIFLHLLSRKLLVHTHAISQHDVDQFPTSVRLIVEVAA